MNSTCYLSRRWHQQFCHSPSFGAHRHCVQTLFLTRQYRSKIRAGQLKDTQSTTFDVSESNNLPNRALSRPNRRFPRNDIVVREFEQHGSNANTRKRIVPDAALQDETKEVWTQIQELEKQLAILKQGPFGPKSPFMQSLPEDERERVLKALADEGVLADQDGDELDLAELDRLVDEDEEEQPRSRLGVTLRIPKIERAYVQRFNKALQSAEEGKGDIVKNLSLWKWYLRSQQRVSNFSKIIPERVWQFLWKSQSELGVRPRHMIMLARDMIAAGQELEDEQMFEYIRSLHAVEETSIALEIWEEQKSRFSQAASDTLTNFFSLGIQLYSSLERPLRAQSAFREGLAKGADPKIFSQVISAFAKDTSPESAVKAWAAYLEMKMVMGDAITPDIYEIVSNSFLDAGHSEMALAVFHDLVVHSKGTRTDLAAQEQVLKRNDSKRSPEDIEKAINEMSLAALLVLPKENHNKFFFASWIKKLIGEKRVDSAAVVADLMFERGLPPDAIHLNGIIGAWFRQGKAESRDKAKHLAENMIQARINLVKQRSQNSSTKEFGLSFRKVMPMREVNNTWIDSIHSTRPTSPANVETFAILLDHYDRSMHRRDFDELISVMVGPAQLQPNIYIMNKVLMSSIKERALVKFWTTYNKMKQHMRLNLETFNLAWHACGLHFAPRAEADKGPSSLYPSSRQMFRDMMLWLRNLKKRDLKQAKEEFDSDLYAQIVKCFCYQMDLPGSVCAIRGLNEHFGAVPDDTAVHLLTGQVARFLPDPQMGNRRGGRLRFKQNLPSNQSLLRELADIVDTLESNHKMRLVESGTATPEEIEDPESDVSQNMKLDVLSEFLTMMMQRTQKEGADVWKTLHDVAAVMQVDLAKMNFNLSS